jgi:hypothetical protein
VQVRGPVDDLGCQLRVNYDAQLSLGTLELSAFL